MPYCAGNHTLYLSKLPLYVIIDVADELRVLRELESDIEEAVDYNEALAMAFDTVKFSHIADQQINIAMEMLLNETQFPLDLTLSKRLICFETIAENIKRKLDILKLYVNGKTPYDMFHRSHSAVVLYREDHYRKVLAQELSRL